MAGMKILHAFWLPEKSPDFIQSGTLRLWCETDRADSDNPEPTSARHPCQLPQTDWPALIEGLGLASAGMTLKPTPGIVLLPSQGARPLPCPELAKALPEPLDVSGATLRTWEVDTIPLERPIKQLGDMHYLAAFGVDNLEPGSDFLFWYWFTQALKQRLLRDQYLPALRYRQPPTPKGKGKRTTPAPEIYGAWQWAAGDDDPLIATAVERMPAACGAGLGVGPIVRQSGGRDAGPPVHGQEWFEPASLLQHCAQVLLDHVVRQTKWPAAFQKRADATLIAPCLVPTPAAARWTPSTPDPSAGLEMQRRWLAWRDRIIGGERNATFRLGFQLAEPPTDDERGQDRDPSGGHDGDHRDQWRLHFVAVAADDPSHRLALADYWAASKSQRAAHRSRLGADFEQVLLLNLGLAARMVPMLWGGLDSAEPQSVGLDLDSAFTFLKESAWVLEDAGYSVIVPAWWTPKGRQRFKLRLRPSAAKPGASAGASPGAGHVNLSNLIQYRYDLAIGDETLSAEEWQQLVEAKTPLVRFRGQWVELDRDKMQEMLAFWREHGSEMPSMSLQEILQRTAEDDAFEVDPDAALATMLERLRNQSRLQPVETPAGLHAELRDYQKRGLAWLGFLEGLGLNGCLADDMGLGKTMQVIARLVQERAGADPIAPTLLVAPTSVIGNWQKEVERFAPSLGTWIHHGAKREQDIEAFKAQAAKHDLIITSYALVRRDQKLLAGVDWHRVVLDEAQNIKNPKADQTRAVCKLQARHRLALTGTPVENRLTDLWSIFNFANPGYLDTQPRFRKRFELPVQRDNDPVQTATLKRLVEPFILRRVKSDKSIIADLPDKLEAIAYCNLSREQAALYESVVRDVEQQLEEKTGIERQGLMLSTLMRLKQICNHPAQFLQDGSAFTAARSHKLERLQAMLEEAMAEGDSVLIFSQFTEIGEQLERMLRRESHYNTYYLHGGTSRARREQMIDAFQDPDGEPSVFVLSLKAGGVGITLTKANHVFHFDRWWNPAVEDQASDRAYRIGQQKTVFVHKFVTLGTLEERIDAMIQDKKALAGAIVGSDESWLTQLDNDRFKDLIRLNRQAVMG
ncbi:DEAD/DEAH box helicase [Thiocapsa rosea]|uniref:SNF2 family DNA or RNA helicase n=1 Tax=Thiocapsa rosea TaxID=69360 RepID=A0A495V1M2_9GAMM|nr:DEAD/DEAH box helicase [Thiocapsa rosea]RKT43311.1 SNF2 family DNA or RNA helicase [Thiocapsa rosea]